MNSKYKAWFWPDRTIGKKESRELREEHNKLFNNKNRPEKVFWNDTRENEINNYFIKERMKRLCKEMRQSVSNPLEPGKTNIK